MGEAMVPISTIGRYQLDNLQKNRVMFLFLDLSEGQTTIVDATLLSGSQRVRAYEVLNFVKSLGVSTNHPIVLICENGSKSMAAALELEANSFINVFVVDGGTSKLEPLRS